MEFEKEYYGDKKFEIFNKVEFQKYIDNFIIKHSKNKTYVMIGLNIITHFVIALN